LRVWSAAGEGNPALTGQAHISSQTLTSGTIKGCGGEIAAVFIPHNILYIHTVKQVGMPAAKTIADHNWESLNP